MWCESCETEVAAEVASDGTVRCGTCGEILLEQGVAPPDDPLRDAQELLDRWSKEPLLEPMTPHPGKDAHHLADSEEDSSEETPTEDESAEQQSSPEEDVEEPEPVAHKPELPPEKKTKFRFDAAHLPSKKEQESKPESEEVEEEPPVEEVAESETEESKPEESTPVTESVRAETDVEEPAETQEQEPVAEEETSFQAQRVDPAQPVAMHSEPHIDIQQLIDERLAKEKKGINWLVLAGQWLSYLGVLGLTAGAALVVYGYFGGNVEMTPKGWMLTTAGQMLLLLGIVTLISGGLEQSNDEVNTRIELLGEQMLRFERETKEQLLRGPKIPAARYGEDAPTAESKKTADQNVDS